MTLLGADRTRPDRLGLPDNGASPLQEFAAASLGIVCPMANEEQTAVPFVRQVLHHAAGLPYATVRMFVVLDRVSADSTRALLDQEAVGEPRLTVVWAPDNRSVVDAYLRGYREALAAGCDWILEIDGGFSHSPAEIARLCLASPGFDCVFGSRFCAGGRIENAPASRRAISFFGGRLANLLLGTRLRDMTSGFQLFSHHALAHVLARGIRSRGPFFQTEMKVICHAFAICEVPITYRSPSHRIGRRALADAAANLLRLLVARLSRRHA